MTVTGEQLLAAFKRMDIRKEEMPHPLMSSHANVRLLAGLLDRAWVEAANAKKWEPDKDDALPSTSLP